MTSHHLAGTLSGTASGVPYLALPPTAVDADPATPPGMVVVLHGLEPPRSAVAFAAAVPMTGVAQWRVYLSLPLFAARMPSGGEAEIRSRAARDYVGELYGPIVAQAAAELPGAVAGLREDLDLPDTPIALVGFSAGATACLLALAQGLAGVRACAAVAPVLSPEHLVAALERRSGTDYPWTDRARAFGGSLDVPAHATRIAAAGADLFLVAGAQDTLTPQAELARLREALRAAGATAVEGAVFRTDHSLTAEPGTDPVPPNATAVALDAALTDWLNSRLLQPPPVQLTEPAAPAEPAEPAEPDPPAVSAQRVWINVRDPAVRHPAIAETH